MLKVAAPPAHRFSGDQLQRELVAAGYRNVAVMQHGATELWIEGHTGTNGHALDERSRPKVEAIVAAHVYVPLEEQVAALRATVADLTARLATIEAHPTLRVVK